MRPVDAALWYAGQGIAVFPCHGNRNDGRCACGRVDCDGQGKHPLTQRGFKDATTDAATVESWFRDHPWRLIGSAYFNVLDFDLYRPGVRDFYEKVAPTLHGGVVADTGNGGIQVFYRGDPNLSQSTSGLPAGVEVRIAGKGYVILPGSAPLPAHLTEPVVKPGGSYRWRDRARVYEGGLTKLPPLPGQVVALLARPSLDTATPAGAPSISTGTPYGRKALEEEARKVALAGNGTRNNQLNRSAFALGQLEATGDLPDGIAAAELTKAAQATQLPAREAATTIKSGLSAGRKNPRPVDRVGARVDAPPPDLHWIDPLAVAPEEIEWLLPKRIPLGMPTLLVGNEGEGKSLFAVWLCAQAAAGKFLDAPISSIYCSAEDHPAKTIGPRLRALDCLPGYISVVDMTAGDVGLSVPEDVQLIEARIEETGAQLVIFDPFVSYLSDGTDSHRDHSVRRALVPLAELAARRSIALVLVVHTNKAAGSDFRS